MSQRENHAPDAARASEADVASALAFVWQQYRAFALGVADLLEGMRRSRAVASSEETVERLQRLESMVVGLLIRQGVRPTANPGSVLDLKYHKVIGVTDSTKEAPPDTITLVEEMGYELLLRGFRAEILRTARVVVAEQEAQQEMKGGVDV